MEAVSRSPIYSMFSETLNGISTIRAFQVQDMLIKQMQTLIDQNTIVWFNEMYANR